MLVYRHFLVLLLTALALVSMWSPAQGQTEVETPQWFEPFEPLIGEWESLSNGEVGGTMRFDWGPRKTYIRWSAVRILGERLIPAFEGIMAYNGVTDRIEFFIPLGSGRVLETGYFDVFEDGRLRRNIEVFYPPGTPLPPGGQTTAPADGLVRRYEHTLIPVDDDTVESSVFYLSQEGTWLAAFPGAEDITLRRTAVGAARE